MKVYVVVVTYNGIKWINNCLKSLSNSVIELDIVVVDNNSKDNTVPYIIENYSNVTVLVQTVNYGFGIANNIGISYALKNKAEFVFLLNQDAMVLPDTICKLINISNENEDYGIISPIHLNGNGEYLDESFDYYIRNFNCDNFISDFILNKPKKNIYGVPMINAAAWLLPKKTLEIVGGFDPMFFLYGEDDNYCQRVLFHNLKIGISPNTSIKHDSGNNFKLNFKKGSDKYYDKFIVRLKVAYGNVNNEKYKELKKIKFFFLKESLLDLLKLNFENFKVNFKKQKLVRGLNFKESVLINRVKGQNYLNKN
jgi:GT2 family glycosyltransferase